VRLPERTLWLSSGPHGRGLPAVAFDAARADPSFLPSGSDFCSADLLQHPVAPPAAPGDGGIAGGSPNACREVDIAIDTDWEYTANVFGGNTNAAAAYALALTAAASEIYTDDLNVRLRVSYLRLWTGENAASDPWNQGSTVDQLFQYRDYWVANEGSVPRDLGHFLSGRGLGGGVAWLPGLCGGNFAFGLSANLGGSFPYPLIDYSGANWDMMVYTHELGHNFGSPHTHSYDPPLDGCGNGDCSAANTGTIMSYCHTCPGGLGNVALNFHPGNVVTMTDFLNGTACDFSGEAQPADAMDDYISMVAGTSSPIDILFNDLRVNCESVSITAFDSTTANGATVTLNPPGGSGRPTFSVAIPANTSTDDSFTYTITDSAGSSDIGTVFIDVIPLLPATNVTGTTPKIDNDYYALSAPSVLPDFSQLTPYLSVTASQVNLPSTNGNFGLSGLADQVGAVFKGWIDVPSSGLYTFYLESDDGSRMLIDGVEVVDNDGLHAMVEKSGVIGLQAGKHLFRVEFFENGGGAGVIARWQGPGFSKQVIPASALSRGGTIGGPDINGDGSVDASDLALLLGAWGTSSQSADLNSDGTVDASDLAILLGAWG
jgi:Metallo-peptidase family M12/PA14 domain/Bacterial Ig domain/Dockerin type I domain